MIPVQPHTFLKWTLRISSLPVSSGQASDHSWFSVDMRMNSTTGIQATNTCGGIAVVVHPPV